MKSGKIVKQGILGTQCIICERKDNLTIHHKSKNKFPIKGSSLKEIKANKNKLELLCQQCHIKHHQLEMLTKIYLRKMRRIRKLHKKDIVNNNREKINKHYKQIYTAITANFIRKKGNLSENFKKHFMREIPPIFKKVISIVN